MLIERGEAAADRVGIASHEGALSVWLDLFRWMAATAVLLAHTNHRLLMRYQDIPHAMRSKLYYLFVAPSTFGEPAVIIFFVLSGYLVGGSSLRRFRSRGDFAWGDYLIARLSRLWTVLLPAFCLTLLFNWLGAIRFAGAQHGVYVLPPAGTNMFAAQASDFLCNAAFLQTALCVQFGGNFALWSLFNEFWYYIAWPCVMIAVWSARTPRTRLLYMLGALLLLGGLTLLQQIGANLLAYFSIWLIGVFAADRNRPLVTMRPWAALSLFVIALLAWRLIAGTDAEGTATAKQFPLDLVVSLIFANLLLVMRNRGVNYPPARRVHRPLAGFSFTLYVIHSPLLNCLGAFFVWAIGTGWAMKPVGPLPYLLCVAAVLICLLSAWLISLVTERNTDRVRAFFTRHLAPRRARGV